MGAHRLTGLDAARGIAVLGMFAVHVGPTPRLRTRTLTVVAGASVLVGPVLSYAPGNAFGLMVALARSPLAAKALRPVAADGARALSVYAATALLDCLTWQYALRGSPLRRGPPEWALRAAAPSRRARRDGAAISG
ncbi:hypothetical protein ACFWBH_34455 [Streptomyces sp. NPDC059999]|uniref:hypothetical protein n=1 Tax=Streptomyces sp. NPDC059999 TaxID=3347030 RepID=UPI003695E4CD